MKKLNQFKILVILFFILFGLSVIFDGFIIYDYFNPCRIDMNKCGDSVIFNLVHDDDFLKIIGIENLLNIVMSCFVIYSAKLKKKYIFIVFGIISILSCFSLWLLLMGEVGIIFN